MKEQIQEMMKAIEEASNNAKKEVMRRYLEAMIRARESGESYKSIYNLTTRMLEWELK